MKQLYVLALIILSCNSVKSQSPYGTVHIPYNESMKPFLEGEFGYNPNLTIEQNREFYKRHGYTLSYKYKDSTIFLMVGFILLLLLSAGYTYNETLKRKRRFESIN